MSSFSFLDRIKYKLLKLELFMMYNFGKGDKGSTQFFSYRFVPQRNFKSQVEASRYFESEYCWSIGSYYILVDTRAYVDRGYDMPKPPGGPIADLDLSDIKEEKSKHE